MVLSCSLLPCPVGSHIDGLMTVMVYGELRGVKRRAVQLGRQALELFDGRGGGWY